MNQLFVVACDDVEAAKLVLSSRLATLMRQIPPLQDVAAILVHKHYFAVKEMQSNEKQEWQDKYSWLDGAVIKVEKEMQAINLFDEFPNEAGVDFFERYVQAALKRAPSEVKGNDRKKVINNLYAAALRSADAAKLLLNHPTSLVGTFALTSEQIKNILQMHRRVFVMENTVNKYNTAVNQIREKYSDSIEEINKENKEEAEKIFLELKTRDENKQFGLEN